MAENINQQSSDQQSNKDLLLYELLIKQQALMLQQFEMMNKERDRIKEQEDEIDLSKLVPKFLRRKKQSDPANIKSTENKSNEDVSLVPTKQQDTVDKIQDTTDKLIAVTNEKLQQSKRLAKLAARQTKELVGSIWAAITTKFNLTIYSFIRYFYIIIIFGALGVIYAGVQLIWGTRIYSASMVLSAGKLNTTFYNGLIYPIGELANTKSYKELGRRLNLDTLITMNIAGVEYGDYLSITLQDEEQENDSTIIVKDRPFFRVVIYVYDNNVLPYVEKALFNYLNNNEFANRERFIRRELMNYNLKIIDKEIETVDSLRSAVIGKIGEKSADDYYVKESGLNTGGSGGLILSQDDKLDIDPMLPFKQMATLNARKLEQQRRLLLLEQEFAIVDGFSANQSPYFPNIIDLIKMVIIITILGIMVTFAVAFVFPKKIKEVQEEPAVTA